MTAIIQRICGGVSEGKEFQQPTGVTSIVADEEVRLWRVK
jgi:hypothetical protein